MQQRDLGGKVILSREDKQQLEVREGRVATAKGIMSTQGQEDGQAAVRVVCGVVMGPPWKAAWCSSSGNSDARHSAHAASASQG